MLKHALDSSELRALSIPSSLHFMLGVELDLFASSVEAGGKPFTIRFPVLAPTFVKLLMTVAKRFGLECVTGKSANGHSYVTGTSTLPLLRYTDFLPGTLHVDEIFTRFNVKPVEQALPLKESGDENLSAEDSKALNFEAHAIPYKTFEVDSGDETHSGLGHYCMLELGFLLATHAHLIAFTARPGKDFEKTIRKFQGFSGWSKFDLRWENEESKSAGVIVLPSVADAVELLEAYEDEDEASEENRLPFILEPLAPTVFVPYMEDSQVKKMRSVHWPTATTFWEQGGAISVDRFSLVVSNFSERVGLNDIVKLFDKEKYSDAILYVDETPHRRRRLLLQAISKDYAREVLDMDAKHYHGAPLRISVAPPFVNRSRFGIELASSKGNGKQPTRLASPALKGMNVTAKEFVPKFSLGGSATSLPAYGAASTGSQPPGYSASALPPPPPPPPATAALPSYDAPPGYNVSPGQNAHPAPPPMATPAYNVSPGQKPAPAYNVSPQQGAAPPPPPPPGLPPTNSPGTSLTGPPGYFMATPPVYGAVPPGADKSMTSPPSYPGADNPSFGNSVTTAPPPMYLPPPG